MANPNGTMLLPPKMAAEFAKLANEGKALIQAGSTYTFIRGNQVITMVCLDPPAGHVYKASQAELASLRHQAANKS